MADWTPDIIYCSSPPPTTLAVGRLLARRYRVPWIAELRDRWADDPYYDRPAWRTRLDSILERWVLASMAGLVTVSEPWAEFYRRKYGKPTVVVFNGYDPKDSGGDPTSAPVESTCLRIVYTGGIYPGRRDPSPLFEALGRIGVDGTPVRVEFFGTDQSHVLPLAAVHGVGDAVVVHAPLPYAEALAEQRRADILLLLQWSDPKEQGNVPSKLFEYLAARRPILGLGYEEGVPARIIRERHAGLYSNDPDVIARQLTRWLDQKRRRGGIALLPPTVCAGFTRDEQYLKLEEFLLRVAREAGKVPTIDSGPADKHSSRSRLESGDQF